MVIDPEVTRLVEAYDIVAETTTATMIAITDLLERIRIDREKANG